MVGAWCGWVGVFSSMSDDATATGHMSHSAAPGAQMASRRLDCANLRLQGLLRRFAWSGCRPPGLHPPVLRTCWRPGLWTAWRRLLADGGWVGGGWWGCSQLLAAVVLPCGATPLAPNPSELTHPLPLPLSRLVPPVLCTCWRPGLETQLLASCSSPWSARYPDCCGAVEGRCDWGWERHSSRTS